MASWQLRRHQGPRVPLAVVFLSIVVMAHECGPSRTLGRASAAAATSNCSGQYGRFVPNRDHGGGFGGQPWVSWALFDGLMCKLARDYLSPAAISARARFSQRKGSLCADGTGRRARQPLQENTKIKRNRNIFPRLFPKQNGALALRPPSWSTGRQGVGVISRISGLSRGIHSRGHSKTFCPNVLRIRP